jgi:hypothetical protein
MAGRVFTVLIAVALSTGCGEASEQAINENFDESFLSNCTSSATGGGMAAELADAACDCALAGINEKYSASEKLTLTNEQATPIAEKCLATVVEQAG